MNGCITTGRRAGYCRTGSPVAEAAFDEFMVEVRDILYEHYFLAAATDGIVIDPGRANDPHQSCHCTGITKSDGSTEELCFKPGVIGTLSQEQNRSLCAVREPMRHPEAFKQRIERFQRASETCVAQGATTLEARISCMAQELRRPVGAP
jgi:hypothetical protein